MWLLKQNDRVQQLELSKFAIRKMCFCEAWSFTVQQTPLLHWCQTRVVLLDKLISESKKYDYSHKSYQVVFLMLLFFFLSFFFQVNIKSFVLFVLWHWFRRQGVVNDIVIIKLTRNMLPSSLLQMTLIIKFMSSGKWRNNHDCPSCWSLYFLSLKTAAEVDGVSCAAPNDPILRTLCRRTDIWTV